MEIYRELVKKWIIIYCEKLRVDAQPVLKKRFKWKTAEPQTVAKVLIAKTYNIDKKTMHIVTGIHPLTLKKYLEEGV